ncbi:MAG: hypothetical protein SGBAC_010718 [Bacillariaceae sp.]
MMTLFSGLINKIPDWQIPKHCFSASCTETSPLSRGKASTELVVGVGSAVVMLTVEVSSSPLLGNADGSAVGSKLGLAVGVRLGTRVATEGLPLGLEDDASVGAAEGLLLGSPVGLKDGASVGTEEGSSVGINIPDVGNMVGLGVVGELLGMIDGSLVGPAVVGATLGVGDGSIVGSVVVGWLVGLPDGSILGALVMVGSILGCGVGGLVGPGDGGRVGPGVGFRVGSLVGPGDGGRVGPGVGLRVGGMVGPGVGGGVGPGVGFPVGGLVGSLVGLRVGCGVGRRGGWGVGLEVGRGVGRGVGCLVGCGVGRRVGRLVGCLVGRPVGGRVGERVGGLVRLALQTFGDSLASRGLLASGIVKALLLLGVQANVSTCPLTGCDQSMHDLLLLSGLAMALQTLVPGQRKNTEVRKSFPSPIKVPSSVISALGTFSVTLTRNAKLGEMKTKKREKERKNHQRKLSVDCEENTESTSDKTLVISASSTTTSKIISTTTSTIASTTTSNATTSNHLNDAPKPKPNNKRKIEASPLHSSETETEKADDPPQYSFQVDDTDHCETPVEAYRDLLDVLDEICKSLNKTRANLLIYDPYYCNGGVKRKLASLGFESVINKNRDFYHDIENHEIPNYDVLVTNPPYSGVHMERLISFVNPSNKTDKKKNAKGSVNPRNKPWLFLLPHFVYTKDYYHRALKSNKPLKDQIYFLVPEVRYSYVPPSWVEDSKGSTALSKGKTKTAPFPSFWYCYTGSKFPKSWLIDTYGPTGSFRSKHPTRKLRYASCTNDIPRDFKGEFDKTKKRPNPKARKRAAAKKRRDTMAGR